MNFKHILMALPLLALPLAAQEQGTGPSFEFGVAGITPNADTNRMTSGRNLAGYDLRISFLLPMKAGFGHRFSIGALAFKGADGTGLEGSGPKHLHASWDLTQRVGEKVNLYAGVMGLKWNIDEAKAILPDFTDVGVNPVTGQPWNNQGKGTKVGFHLGADYAVTRSFSATFGYTQTEFNKKLNPSWFSVGMSYRFNLK